MNLFRKIASAFVAFLLTGRAQVFALNCLGHKIAPSASIGFSILFVDCLCLGDGAWIGHCNIFVCRRVVMRKGAYIRSFNAVRGAFSILLREAAAVGKWNRFVKARSSGGHSVCILDRSAAVALSHYLNVDDSIVIGENSILAGMGSQIWTHGFVHLSDRTTRAKIVGPVRIGANVYVGSSCILNPNVVIGDDVTLGSGASVARDLLEPGLYVPGALRFIPRSPEERLAGYRMESAGASDSNPVYRRARDPA